MIAPGTIGVLGRIGPVRRLAPLRYRAACPSCEVQGAATITITPHGERVSCRACPLVDVTLALQALAHRQPSLPGRDDHEAPR